MNTEVRPFVLLSERGGVIAVLQTNEKGFKKSIENNCLWTINPETARLLPEDGFGRPKAFREGGEAGGWYEAVLSASEDYKASDPGIAPEEDEPAGEDAAVAPSAGSDVIERLYGVIEARKKELPEGSYTTHLFNSGISKIKKKTGEEAVELLLAEDRGEIIYEAADLIYHMLVLLSAADINPAEIFKELKNRE